MAAFEKERSSRRFYSLAKDDRPAHPGGIPVGSILTHTDTGDRFIFDGKVWLPFVGTEDVVAVLDDIHDALNQILRENQVARAAVATMANDQSGGEYPTE